MNHFVFVYGTLRKHEFNHRLLAHAKCVAAQARTKGKLYDTGFGYPALVQSEKDWTYGELYEVDDATLQQTNQLEGFHGEGQTNLYDRIMQPVSTDQGITQAYVYVAGELLADLQNDIIGGDWRVYRLLQQKQEILYFAYGFCMDTERFKKAGFCRYFQNVLGKGVVENYKIGFIRHASDGGRAGIIEEEGYQVEGKVYRVPTEALSYLYRREGVISGCYRPTMIDVTINGKLQKDVLSFTVVDKKEDIAPPVHYVEEIRRGGQDVFSPSYNVQFNQLIKNLNQKQLN